MGDNLKLQLETLTSTSDASGASNYSSKSTPTYESAGQNQDEHQEWTSAFNTSIISTREQTTKDRTNELSEVLNSTEYSCLLLAAKQLSVQLNLSKEESTERIITAFRKIDRAWKHYLIQRGIDSITKS